MNNIIKLRFNKIKNEDLIIPIKYEGIIKIKVFDGNKIIHQNEVTNNNQIVITNKILNTIKDENFKLFIEGDVTEFNNHDNSFKNSLIEIIDIHNGSLTKLKFTFCKELKKVNITNIPKVSDFNCMFSCCSNLTTIPLFDTSNGTDFNCMFSNCYKLKTIPLFDTSKGTSFNSMYDGCGKLKTNPNIDKITKN